MHAGVANHERLADRTLAGGIRRPVEDVSVERDRRRAAGVERETRDAAVVEQHQGEIPIADPDAPATPTTVRRDQHDAAVRTLADRRPWIRPVQLDVGKRFARVLRPDRLAVADERGPASDGVRHRRPLLAQSDAHGQLAVDERIGTHRVGRRAARHEHGAVARNRDTAVADERRHPAGEVAERLRRGEGLDHCGDTVDRRGRVPPDRREQGRAVRMRRLVELRQWVADRAEAPPARVERNEVDVEVPGRVDADRRSLLRRLMLDDAAAHQQPARPAADPVEEVAVDADRRHLRRHASLHRRYRLAPADRIVRKQRGEAVDARGPRRVDDVCVHGAL